MRITLKTRLFVLQLCLIKGENGILRVEEEGSQQEEVIGILWPMVYANFGDLPRGAMDIQKISGGPGPPTLCVQKAISIRI